MHGLDQEALAAVQSFWRKALDKPCGRLKYDLPFSFWLSIVFESFSRHGLL